MEYFPHIALGVLAVAFAFASGANDGGVLLAMGTRYSGLTLPRQIVFLAAMLVVMPVVGGVNVAHTLAEGLFDPSHGTWLFVIGAAWPLVVTFAFNRVGIPTSLSLALVGGLTGVALGSGQGIRSALVIRVLLVAAAAPLVAGVLGFVVDRIARLAGNVHHAEWAMRGLHRVSFFVQCAAYALNDGQKMLAVGAVALGVLFPNLASPLSASGVWCRLVVLMVLVIFFVIGTLLTLRPVTRRVGYDIAQLRPFDEVSAELLSGITVIGSSALGVPVSMSQALTGAVIGLSGSKGTRRVRWRNAGTIVVAWIATLPVSVVGAAGISALYTHM